MQSTVTLVGNIAGDVTLRETSSGLVVNFRMAASNGWYDKRQQRWVDRTTFFNVSAWRQFGENVAASVHRGQPVVVVGRLRQREFERDGRSITVVEVDADLVGHDLTRGSAVFARNPRGPQTSEVRRVEDAPSTSSWAAPGVGADADRFDDVVPLEPGPSVEPAA